MEKTGIPSHFPTSVQDWLNYTLLKTGDQQIRAIIRFSGRIDSDLLSRAIRLTLDAEPVLGCGFNPHPWKPIWRRIDNLDSIKHLTIVSSDNIDQEIAGFMGCRIDPQYGPQVKAKVIRSTNDTLLLAINHMVADGTGVKEYLYLLADIYNKLKSNKNWRPVPNLKDRGQAQLLKQIRFRNKCRSLLFGHYPKQSWGFPYRNRDTSNPTYALKSIYPQDFKAIQQYAKAKQITLNDLFVTAFYNSLFHFVQPNEGDAVPMLITVDLRRYLPSKKTETICNLSGSLFISLRYQRELSFEEVLRQVKNGITTEKKHYPGLGMAFLMECISYFGFQMFQKRSDKLTKDAMITGNAYPTPSNLGVIDSDLLWFKDITVDSAWIMGPTPYPPAFLVLISTFKEQVTFCSAYCKNAVAEGMVENLLERMVDDVRRQTSEFERSIRS